MAKIKTLLLEINISVGQTEAVGYDPKYPQLSPASFHIKVCEGIVPM